MPAATEEPRHPDCGEAMQVAHTCVRVKSRAISDFVCLSADFLAALVYSVVSCLVKEESFIFKLLLLSWP